MNSLAAVLEFHYTYAPSENVGISSQNNGSTVFFAPGPQDTQFFDMTVGLHAEFAHRTIARLGLAFPLLNDWGERSYDGQILCKSNGNSKETVLRDSLDHQPPKSG